MSRDIDMHNAPTLVRQYGEDEQHTAREVAMPSQDRVRLNEHDRGAPMSADSGQDDPKNPVAPPEMLTLDRPFDCSQLLPEGHILQDQFVMPVADHR